MDSSDAISASQASEDVSRPEEPTETSGPAKYWLKKGDTLHGVALRFKVDGREICRLNGLPPSTLSTTPHLLHTRSFILLPPTDRKPPPPPPEAEAREEQRKKERAAKQFQFVTKEVDWRIAKAYVALADIDDIDDEYGMKRKEAGRARPQSGTAGTAVERYMDDDEWERDQLQAGLSPRIPQFPFFASKA
ncbi:hypothetical protein M408DRAFT_60834 [Serendipita vermifera MAFF 305830]|uniref:LysM domain-containing protein n=1 Tax=Serendipita vermifera MAFF 305830 TaxID=933852 RepID=A0A0C3BPL9_SERVB|nr:hypothetical protein M408DRAFT_60834 [Serendipita vermifera MAFF 305830]